MFKVKVLTIGKWNESWLKAATQEYEKRLQGKLTIQWILLKDDEELLRSTESIPYIALHPQGKLLSSSEWSQKMMKLGLRLNFLIGGPEGLPAPILEKALFQWSLSPLTFTHQIARLILVEQLYRSIEIERGSRYHK